MSEVDVFVCSHMRPVVWLSEDDVWVHINNGGFSSSVCMASVTRHTVEVPARGGVPFARASSAQSAEARKPSPSSAVREQEA